MSKGDDNVRKSRKRPFESLPYLDAYREQTDRRVAKDPHKAVGGRWEEMGQLQLNFLKRQGLQPAHRLLDIGCGTLRAGRHLIPYLDTGNYTGFDLSPAAIAYAQNLVSTEGLSNKRPRLFVNEEKDLNFTTLTGQTFDYLLAQSVFTHLMPEHIEECYASVGRVMHPQSRFYFTFREGPKYERTSVKDFAYPFSFFAELGVKYGLKVERKLDFPHPRQTRAMVLLQPGQTTRDRLRLVHRG